jgi:hypothetical protein
MAASAPSDLVDIGLMEKFGWTPAEIDEIPLGRLQRIFVVMEQREQSQQAAMEIEAKRKRKK